jgi:hypothetical protein
MSSVKQVFDEVNGLKKVWSVPLEIEDKNKR